MSEVKLIHPVTGTELPHDFNGAKVLLVEDNELIRDIEIAILDDINIDCDIAQNGQEALNILENALPGHYDAILMDIAMPVMDGYEATRRIRRLEDPAVAQTPVIGITAYAYGEDKEVALVAGMNDTVAKPVEIPTLMETLARYIK